MGYHLRSLLLVAVFGAAAMAASGVNDTMPPLPEFQMPPLPSPADMPELPPCLESLSVCRTMTVYDSAIMEQCCTAVKKLYKSDPTCICDSVRETQKMAKKYGYNESLALETFRQCDMPTTSCDPGQPGSQNMGNGAPSGRSIGAFQIMLLLPLVFIML